MNRWEMLNSYLNDPGYWRSYKQKVLMTFSSILRFWFGSALVSRINIASDKVNIVVEPAGIEPATSCSEAGGLPSGWVLLADLAVF
jgi:hypothetical protein